MNNKLLQVLIIASVYFLSTSFGYFVFASSSGQVGGSVEETLSRSRVSGSDFDPEEFDQSDPKTDICP